MLQLIFSLASFATGDVFTADTTIDDVTVYQNGAFVVRAGQVVVPRGRSTVRVDGLPGGLQRDSIRVSVGPATVVRVDAVSIQRPQITVEAAEEKLTRLEALRRQRERLVETIAHFTAEGALLKRLVAQPGEGANKPAPALPSTSTWLRVNNFVESRYLKGRKEKAALQSQVDRLDEQIAVVTGEFAQLTQGAWTQSLFEVRAEIETTSAGKVPIRVEYAIPGTQWQPSYELHFDPQRRRTRLRMVGWVRQTTGEDWADAHLHLATTHLAQRVALPKLLTWTLGEERDFVPRHQEAGNRSRPSAFPLPPQLPPVWQHDELRRLESLRGRLSQQGFSQPSGGVQETADMELAPEPAPLRVAKPRMEMRLTNRKASRRRASRPKPRLRRDVAAPSAMVAESLSDSVMLWSEAEPPPVSSRMQMGLMHDPSPPRRPLPLGGYSHVYATPIRVTLKSGAERQSVPLATFDMSTKPFYETTPALEEKVFLTAEVGNSGGIPLLAGPVAVYANHSFIVDAMLPATGPKGSVKLPLGVDHDIEVVRRMSSRKVTSGTFSQRDVTRYEVTIEAVSRKKDEIRLRVHDQIPRSRSEDVEIKLVEMKPMAAKGPGETGLLSWDLRVPGGQKQTVRLVYEVLRPRDWEVLQ